MGRRKIEKPQASEDTIKLVKQMIKEYPQRKYEIYAYEHSKVKMLRYITTGLPFTKDEFDRVKYYAAKDLPRNEKNALMRYFEDREIVFLLESGMETVPKGQRKDIAHDRIFNNMNSHKIIEKYDVAYITYRRAMREAINYIGVYVENYVRSKDKMSDS